MTKRSLPKSDLLFVHQPNTYIEQIDQVSNMSPSVSERSFRFKPELTKNRTLREYNRLIDTMQADEENLPSSNALPIAISRLENLTHLESTCHGDEALI